MVDLQCSLGVDAQSAQRHHVPAHHAAQRGTRAIGAEPLTQGGQRAGPDDLPLGSHPLQGQLVPLADAAGAAHVADALMCRQRHSGSDASRSVDVAAEAPLHEFGLELRVDHVRLHHRVHVLFVDLDDPVHAAHVELDAARAARVAVDAPTGAGSLELHSEPVAQPHDGLNLFGASGHEDGFEARLELLRQSELARAPRPGVQVHRVGGDVVRADDGLKGLVVLVAECHVATPPRSLCLGFRRRHRPRGGHDRQRGRRYLPGSARSADRQ